MNRLTKSVLTVLVACSALSCAPDTTRDLPLSPEGGVLHTGSSSDLLGLTSSSGGDKNDEQQNYVRIEDKLPSDIPSLSVSSVIGLLGGEVHLAGHVISVPVGAVSLPTVFTLTVATNGYVEVDITALTTNLLGSVINIGEEGFRKPVTLSLTYARATNVTDPTRLKLMRLKADGKHEILASRVSDEGRTVTAELDHFSRYCMIAN